MKVVVSGSENRRIECQRCRCVYEFDEDDVQTYDLRDELFALFIPSTEDTKIEYVECPECGKMATLNRLPKKNEIKEDNYTIRAMS